MIFNVLSILSVAGATTAAILDRRADVAILYPRPGTFWTAGYAHNVTWIPTQGSGSIALANGGSTLPLASNVDLTAGRVEVNVPRVNSGSGYIVQVVSDGTTSNSGEFQIGTPDVPGPQPSVSIGSSTTVVILPSTSVVSGATSAMSSASSAISSATDSASSALSSAASSASSVASEITASASSALSSLASGASSVASGVQASATSIRSSLSSAAASATSTSSSAMGMHSTTKFGAVLTAGVVVVATIAGAAIF